MKSALGKNLLGMEIFRIWTNYATHIESKIAIELFKESLS